ncbi:MAG: glycosyltransferase [Chloroflexi bacterium]|nr:glycosyltransferase [Chloroflexota bacterium]
MTYAELTRRLRPFGVDTTVHFVGAHDPSFARTALIADGLRAHGIQVHSMAQPAWGSTAERVRAARRGLLNPALAWRLVRAYARLVGQMRHTQSPPEWLYVGYPGQLDAIVLRALRPRARIAMDAFVSIDETLADRAIGRVDSASRRLARALDRMAFRCADVVVTDTAAHTRRFSTEYGLDARKSVVVPVGARDPGSRAQVPPAEPLSADAPSPADGKPTPGPLRVLYFGGFIPLHGIPVILDAARLLGPEAGISFDLVGDGQGADDAARSLAIGDLPHVSLRRDWMPESVLIDRFVANADVCLGIFAKSPKAMDVVPAKAYLALACGKPLVTADSPAVREELLGRATSNDPSLLTCTPGDAASLASALLSLRDDAALRARMGAAGRRLYLDNFTPDRIVEPLLDRLSLIGAHPRDRG